MLCLFFTLARIPPMMRLESRRVVEEPGRPRLRGRSRGGGEAQPEEGEGRPEKIVLSVSQAFIVS